MKFSLENHSGDVNNHSGRIGFFIHFSPESLFTSRRNPYSHHSGTIIHMPRNPQEVADILRCSKAHVHNAIHGKVQGLPKLTHLTMGRRKLVRRDWLEQWLETNKTR